ncbi:MAG: hypothetical protein PHT88_00110 [Candidatus Moranbacteria bacterium]|nr:hypothetical protein [Candidatus Moranbacteria bacterium]
MRKIALLLVVLFGFSSFASADEPVLQINILNGGTEITWTDDTMAINQGFVQPFSIGADEAFEGITLHSKKSCFGSSTTIGRYNPGIRTIFIPGTANNDTAASFSATFRNTKTGAIRELYFNIDAWDLNIAKSILWNQAADGTLSWNTATGQYQEPVISYENGNVVVRFNTDVISGFLANGAPACGMNTGNIQAISIGIDGSDPIIGTITQDVNHNYVYTFPGVATGTTFTLKTVMGKNDEDRWLDMSFFAPGNGIVFNTETGTLTVTVNTDPIIASPK